MKIDENMIRVGLFFIVLLFANFCLVKPLPSSSPSPGISMKMLIFGWTTFSAAWQSAHVLFKFCGDDIDALSWPLMSLLHSLAVFEPTWLVMAPYIIIITIIYRNPSVYHDDIWLWGQGHDRSLGPNILALLCKTILLCWNESSEDLVSAVSLMVHEVPGLSSKKIIVWLFYKASRLKLTVYPFCYKKTCFPYTFSVNSSSS